MPSDPKVLGVVSVAYSDGSVLFISAPVAGPTVVTLGAAKEARILVSLPYAVARAKVCKDAETAFKRLTDIASADPIGRHRLGQVGEL